MISLLLDQFWPYIAGAVFLALAFFGVRQSGKSAGRQEAEQKQAKGEAKAREVAKDVDQQIDALGDDSVRDRATDWLRDGKR